MLNNRFINLLLALLLLVLCVISFQEARRAVQFTYHLELPNAQ
jgi:hypothetical protein